jgi:hypothetical protein
MKTICNIRNWTRWTAVMALALLGACGGIPSAYQGNFRDESLGVDLQLGSSEGTLTDSQNPPIKTEAMALAFDALAKGKPGIYLRKNPAREDLIDIYWIQPRFQEKQEGGGLVWYPSDVYYTLVSTTQKEKVNELKMLRSDQGLVTLEPSTKAWQVGWPAHPTEYHFHRVK